MGAFSRDDEFIHFIGQLKRIIVERNIELLLVAGDVFHSANPSHTAVRIWLEFLGWAGRAEQLRVVVIPGNHDSTQLLSGPKELAEELGIYIQQGITAPIRFDNVQVFALPFLKEMDLLNHFKHGAMRADERDATLRRLQVRLYHDLYNEFADSGLVSILCAHTFILGMRPSLIERDMFAGGVGAISAEELPSFDFAALGHIHRGSIVQKDPPVMYSGNPVQLDFSESESKSLWCFDTEDAGSIERIPLSLLRPFISLEGAADEIIPELTNLSQPSWIELRLKGIARESVRELEAFVMDSDHRLVRILRKETEDAALSAEEEVRLSHLHPLDVFGRRLEEEEIEGEDAEKLVALYKQVLKEVESHAD